VNVCSLEFDRAGSNWELGEGGSRLLETLADPTRWNANAVRMPVNQQWFLEDESYAQLVEALLDDADRRSLYVLLDVQWEQGRALDPYYRNILPIPTFGNGNTTEAFWHKAVSRWANRTNLLYDLVNEPHDVDAGMTAEAMQVLVDRIRRMQGEAVIVVGGMNWAHTIDYYRVRPLTGTNLVYSAHPYLPYDSPAAFRANFLEAAKQLPVILGEFTIDEQYFDGKLYQRQLVEEAENGGVDGWMPWAIGCGFGKDDWNSTEVLRYLSGQMRVLNQ
jgi:endoglucanase